MVKGASKGLPTGQNPPRTEGTAPPSTVNGDDLRLAFEAATRYLERHRDAINALNVFPVPDGDTGTNMLLTMRSVNEESGKVTGASAGAVMAAMAHGALLGARGNSGVILSQFFHGLSRGFQGKDECDGEDLARAFGLASEAAQTSVSAPVDGTMLTVIRELSLAASKHAGGAGEARGALSVWQAGLEASKEALSRTPLQLPVLREAGVVDAGGQGIVTLLHGALRYLAGDNVDDLEPELCAPVGLDLSSVSIDDTGTTAGASCLRAGVQEEFLAATEHELYGYCVQYLIEGLGLDLDRIRGELSSIAQSTVVVGGETLVKVHGHAHDPGPLLSYGITLGAIAQVRIDNIDQQHREFILAQHGQMSGSAGGTSAVGVDSISAVGAPGATEAPGMGRGIGTAVVAVAWGEGFARLFKGLGCSDVVIGGQTMNPSTQELLRAAGESGAENLVLLPNNANVVPAALQAASLARDTVSPSSSGPGPGGLDYGITIHVVPSRTIPQGVAALLAFNPEGDLDENLRSMEMALSSVTTVEVTRAVRRATVNGVAVVEGQYIGLLEGELVTAGQSALQVLTEVLAKAEAREGQLVTLYWGQDMEEGQAGSDAARLRETLPDVEVEVVYGGQPHYHYIASLE